MSPLTWMLGCNEGQLCSLRDEGLAPEYSNKVGRAGVWLARVHLHFIPVRQAGPGWGWHSASWESRSLDMSMVMRLVQAQAENASQDQDHIQWHQGGPCWWVRQVWSQAGKSVCRAGSRSTRSIARHRQGWGWKRAHLYNSWGRTCRLRADLRASSLGRGSEGRP